MERYIWTRHSQWKMKQYALSEQRIKRVMRNPERVEKSIVPGMIASMQATGSAKNRYEIWVMYELIKYSRMEKILSLEEKIHSISKWNTPQKTLSPAQIFREKRRQEHRERQIMSENTKILRIISAWKYPGESPKKDPIPDFILEEIQQG